MTPTPDEAGLPPLTPMLREALLGLAARIDYAYGDPIAIGVEAADAIRAAIAAQQQRQAAPEWISVEERLPEKFTEVLIAFKDCTLPATGQYTGSPHDDDGWCYPAENHGDGFDWTVTHWMELPATPKELADAAPEQQEAKDA